MKLGITPFCEHPPVSTNLGLLTHAHVLDEQGTPVYRRLLDHPQLKFKTLFGPQHGFWMDTSQAMMVPTASTSSDRKLTLPIYSLYRQDSRDVDPRWLTGLDAIVVDLPDVGVKVYTYLWSVAKMMQACAKTQIPLIILDRPNPIAGLGVSGPMTQKEFTSFIGLYPIAFCHGLTLGEAARYLNDTFQLGCPLTLVQMEGWRRNSFWDDYPLPWFNPSPNLRSMETLLHYPATVMIEATNVSEGRGTDLPFIQVGAPTIHATDWLKVLDSTELPGVKLTPVTFTPDSDKHAGQRCEGIQLTCTDRKTYNPVWTGCVLLWTLKKLSTAFRFREPPYEYEFQKNPFDITVGTDRLRTLIEKQAPLQEIKSLLENDTQVFIRQQKPFRLYP